MICPEVECCGLSDVGPLREENQDALRISDERSAERGLLYALADGMGGYARGDLASKLALDALFDTFKNGNDTPAPRILRRGVEIANLKVYQTAQQLGVGHMGATLTAAYVSGDRLHLAHVGDSRAYLVRNGRAVCLTTDHTVAGDLMRMHVIPPDKVRMHAQRSILTRCIGLELFVRPDIIQTRLREDDRLILCSDGLWSVIEDEEFAQLTMKAENMETLGRELIGLALARQTDDNASVITLHIRRLAHPVHDVGARGGNGILDLLFHPHKRPGATFSA